ncbi:MAG: hypothetical protein KAS01_01190 [Candidatus Pacebacteria bacterium]|nr:hypothetical protein [Candidatus Paceibacterota bacterium]
MREKYFEIKTGNEPEDDRVVKISKIENDIAKLEENKPDDWRKDIVKLKGQIKEIGEENFISDIPVQSEADISEEGGLLENQSENEKEDSEDFARGKTENMKLFLEELKKTDFSSLSLEELKEKTENIKIFRDEVRITNITDDNLKKKVGDLKNELSKFDMRINFKIGEINEANRIQQEKISEDNQDNNKSFEGENSDSEDMQPSKKDRIADKKLRKNNFSTSEEVEEGLKRKSNTQREISRDEEKRKENRNNARILKRQEDPVESWKDELSGKENITEEKIEQAELEERRDKISQAEQVDSDEIPVVKNEEDVGEMGSDELDKEIKRVNEYLAKIIEERGIDNEDFTEQSIFLALLISAKEGIESGEISEPETLAVIEVPIVTNAEAIERLERMDVFIELAKNRLVDTEERLSKVEGTDVSTLLDKEAVKSLASADLLGTELSKLYLIDPENMTEDQLRELQLAKAEKITDLKKNLELGVFAMKENAQKKLIDAQAEKELVETSILREKKKGFVVRVKNMFFGIGVAEATRESVAEIPVDVASNESEEATHDFGYLNGIENIDGFEKMILEIKKQLKERAGRWPGKSKSKSKEIIKVVEQLPLAITADNFVEKKEDLLGLIKEHKEELKDKKIKKEEFVKYANAVLNVMGELLEGDGRRETVEEVLNESVGEGESQTPVNPLRDELKSEITDEVSEVKTENSNSDTIEKPQENNEVISEEIQENLRKGLIELRKKDVVKFKDVKDFIKSFKNEEKLFREKFKISWFDNSFMRETGIFYDDLKDIRVKYFMSVLMGIYEEVKKENVSEGINESGVDKAQKLDVKDKIRTAYQNAEEISKAIESKNKEMLSLYLKNVDEQVLRGLLESNIMNRVNSFAGGNQELRNKDVEKIIEKAKITIKDKDKNAMELLTFNNIKDVIDEILEKKFH